MGGPGFWFWLVAVAILAFVGVLIAVGVKNGFSRPIILGIATIVFCVLLLFIPVQVVQANGLYIVGLLALAWVGYFVWRLTQKGWSSPPTMSQMNRALLDFTKQHPQEQIVASIPSVLFENPTLPSKRRQSMGMLILTGEGVYCYGPKVRTSLRVPASDVQTMSIVTSQLSDTVSAPSVLITSKSGQFEWCAISGTGQEGAELILGWGERLYA